MRTSKRTVRGALLLFLVFTLGSARGIGQQAGPEASGASPKEQLPHTYGTQDRVYYRIAATELLPAGAFDSSLGYHTGDQLRYPVGAVAAARFEAVPHLPQGALVTYVELDACDEDASDDILASLMDCNYLGHCETDPLVSISSAGLSACASRSAVLSPGYRVDNFFKELLVRVDIPGGGFAGVAGVILGYKLEVSPAPATASFGDVPTNHVYFRAIEALADSGITQGCGGGNYCPSQFVTRGELAKFLANALGLHW